MLFNFQNTIKMIIYLFTIIKKYFEITHIIISILIQNLNVYMYVNLIKKELSLFL